MEARILQPGRNCWRLVKADRAAFLIDGADYFAAFREAAVQARHSILVTGWDLHSRTRLVPDDPGDGLPVCLGDLLSELTKRNRSLKIHLLEWDFALVYALERELRPVFQRPRGFHRKIQLHLDDAHPMGGSHHQKIVVIDDSLAFVGGLDLTQRRWDTSQHLPDDPRRVDPRGLDYKPFHDVQIMLEGPAAGALGDLFRERWRRATGRKIPPPKAIELSPWPRPIEAWIRDVPIAIARTEPAWEQYPEVREVQRLYLDSIAAARAYIYIENQFLTSTRIVEAIRQRLQAPHPPEIVIVSRLSGGGWLEKFTMEVLRARILKRLDTNGGHDNLRIYYPHRADLGQDCIEVHSKLMIADDRFVRVGSANLSNRSMGYDTECDVAFEAVGPGQRAAVRRLCLRLIGEHLGLSPAQVEQHWHARGSLISAIESLRGNQRSLEPIPYEIPPEIDALVPQVEVIDPETPLGNDPLTREMLPPDQRRVTRRHLASLALLLLLLGGLAASWRWTPLGELVDAQTITGAMENIRASGLASLWVIGIFLVAGLVSFPITIVIIATVAIFGPYEGFAYAWLGMMISSLATYGIGRLLGSGTIRRIAGPKFKKISHYLVSRGIVTTILVRIIPIAPFTLVNLVAGAANIKKSHYALGTALGIVPGLVLLSVFADQAGSVLRDPQPETVAYLILTFGAIGLLFFMLAWGLKRLGLTDT